MSGTHVPEPLGTSEEFHQMLIEMASALAPNRFAICEQLGDRVDGRIAGWGLAFVDQAVVCPTDDGLPNRFNSPASALRRYSAIGDMRLIWIDEPAGDDED
jgi:hypothetical protein